MPLVCEPDDLMAEARCLNSCIPPGMELSVVIYLLTEILLSQDPMADIGTNNLLRQSRCFNSCIPPGSQLAVANYLLCQIALNGINVGVGTPQVFSGNGAPVGLQVGQNPALPAVYYDENVPSTTWIWNTGSGTWN